MRLTFLAHPVDLNLRLHNVGLTYLSMSACLDNDDSDRTIEWSTAIFSHSVHRPSPIAMRLRSHEAVSSHHATDRRVKTLETTQRYDLDVKLWKTNINASPTRIELYIDNARDYAFSGNDGIKW